MHSSRVNKQITPKDEYNCLRNELLACQERQHSSNWGGLSLVVAILAFSITLPDIANLQLNGNDYYQIIQNVYLIVLKLVSYILPLIIVFTLSIKAEKNYKQMMITSIYLQVMYEYPASKEQEQICTWESNRQELMCQSGDVMFLQKIYTIFNKKYINSKLFLFAWFVNMFQGTLMLVDLYRIWTNVTTFNFHYCAIGVAIFAFVLCLFVCTVWYNTNLKQLHSRYEEFYKDKIIEMAVKNKVISTSEIDECWEFIAVS